MGALVQDRHENTVSAKVRDSTLQADTDAIVRVDAVTTCHEAVGTVEVAGPKVKTIDVGDRVLVAGVSPRATCNFAERVRVPFADTCTCKVPEAATDGQLMMLASFFRPATPRSVAARAR